MMSSIKIPRCLQLTFENSLRWFKKGFSNESFFLFPRTLWLDRADTSPVNTFTEVTRSRKIEKIYIAFIIKRIKDLKHEYFAIHNVLAQNKITQLLSWKTIWMAKQMWRIHTLERRSNQLAKLFKSTSRAPYMWIFSSIQYEIV